MSPLCFWLDDGRTTIEVNPEDVALYSYQGCNRGRIRLVFADGKKVMVQGHCGDVKEKFNPYGPFVGFAHVFRGRPVFVNVRHLLAVSSTKPFSPSGGVFLGLRNGKQVPVQGPRADVVRQLAAAGWRDVEGTINSAPGIDGDPAWDERGYPFDE